MAILLYEDYLYGRLFEREPNYRYRKRNVLEPYTITPSSALAGLKRENIAQAPYFLASMIINWVKRAPKLKDIK